MNYDTSSSAHHTSTTLNISPSALSQSSSVVTPAQTQNNINKKKRKVSPAQADNIDPAITTNSRPQQQPQPNNGHPQMFPIPPHLVFHPYPPPPSQLDFTPGGTIMTPLPAPHPAQLLHPPTQAATEADKDGSQSEGGDSGEKAANGRPLSKSKRAEQNRRAQRAFRERRDMQAYLTPARACD
jgi:hypothetical protein